jgi:hypothetical protein
MEQKELQPFDTAAFDRNDDIEAVEEGRGTSMDEYTAKLLQEKLKQDQTAETVVSKKSGFKCPECPEDWPLLVSYATCVAGCIGLFVTLTSEGHAFGDYDFDWRQNGAGNMTAVHNISKIHME